MTDTLRSTVKEKLAVGEVVSSMTVRLVPGVEIVQVIKSAGFDSFYINLEHPLTIETTNKIATTALAAREQLLRPRAGEHAGLYLAGAGR